MREAAQAYGKVAHQTANPRELEAKLLLQAAAQLQLVHDTWHEDGAKLGDALTFNRKLWSLFLGAVTDTDSPLPREIRQNVANLGVFVMNQTLELMGQPDQSKLGVLIKINREIATGLLNRG
jgi:flagellar protein FlaF